MSYNHDVLKSVEKVGSMGSEEKWMSQLVCLLIANIWPIYHLTDERLFTSNLKRLM